MARIKSVKTLIRESELCEKGKILFPDVFFVQALHYYNSCIHVGLVADKIQEERVRAQRLIIDKLITEYYPGRNRPTLKKHIFERRADILMKKALMQNKKAA